MSRLSPNYSELLRITPELLPNYSEGPFALSGASFSLMGGNLHAGGVGVKEKVCESGFSCWQSV